MEEAKRLRPDLRVLFMSGYTDHPARGSGPLYKTAVPEAAAIRNQPFRKRDLARRPRAAPGCGPASARTVVSGLLLLGPGHAPLGPAALWRPSAPPGPSWPRP